MSFLSGSEVDFSNTNLAPRPGKVDLTEPVGIVESAGAAIGTGLSAIGTTAFMAEAATVGNAADYAISRFTGEDSDYATDMIFGSIVEPNMDFIMGQNHKERTFGGSLTYGIGQVLTEFMGGGAGVLATAQYTTRAAQEIKEGNTLAHSQALALTQAAFAYAGASLPGAIGGTIAKKAASGAAINVVAGVGQRGAELGLLTLQDDERAASATVFGGADILTDIVLGAAFGVLEPRASRTKTDDVKGEKSAGMAVDEPSPTMPDAVIDDALSMQRTRFDDAQVIGHAPDVVAKIDLGFEEVVQAYVEDRASVVERLPDAVTMSEGPRDGPLRPKSDDVLTAIAKMGGVSRTEALANGIDPASFKERRGGATKYVFRKDGASFDQMAGRLDELGYPVRDATGKYSAGNVLDVVARALKGEDIRTPAGHERVTKDAAGIAAKQESQSKYDFNDGSIEDALGGKPEDAITSEPSGIKKPDPSFKALDESVKPPKQADLTAEISPEVTPEMAQEMAATADLIRAEAPEWMRDIIAKNDHAAITEADTYIAQVKAVGKIMGCLFSSGVSGAV